MPILKKAIADLTVNDLAAVIAERWPEDEQLELKRELPTKPEHKDRWSANGEIVERAKVGLFSEVVAFANSYGGDLIVGIDESDDNPKRAQGSAPVPRCADLADQLAMVARGVIDPQIPRLEFRGIPIADAGDAGYVVIRVPKSRLAPHRLTLNKECYKRRGGSSEAMTMREIQDLTFAVARGTDAIDRRLAGVQSTFREWVRSGAKTGERQLCMRVTGTPASSDLFIERVHDVPEVMPPRDRFLLQLDDPRPHELSALLSSSQNWRPILRGTQARGNDINRRSLIQLDCDGTVSYFWNSYFPVDTSSSRRGFLLYPGWLFGLVLNAFRAADRFREFSSAHAVEYVFEIEVVPDIELPVMRVDHWEPLEVAGTLPPTPPLVLPRYAVGGTADRNAVLNLIWRDFWNAVGVETKPDEFKLV